MGEQNMDTKRGRLGVAELAAATLTSVYAVTDGNDALVNVFISNLAGAYEDSEIDVAIVDGAVGDVADEDYIIRGFSLKLGEYIPLLGLNLSANECICVQSTRAGITVRVSGVEEETALTFGIKKLTSQSLEIANFTDNANTTGYIDFTTGQLPIGAIVLGWKATTTVGFAGDTTAVVQVGVSGDVDAFSANVAGSCLAVGVVGSASLAAASATPIAVAKTPRVTVTGASDFGLIVTNATGTMVVDIYYMNTAPAVVEDAANNYPVKALVSQSLEIANFTDNAGTATGYIDFTTGVLPAGAIVLGWKAVTSVGFGGDTTAIVMVGISGDTDAYSALTTGSCLVAGTVGSAALAATAATPIAAFSTPRVTITGTADFTSIVTAAAGTMVVTVFYILTD